MSFTKALDNNKFTIAICLDLTKAFDTVNHSMLLSKRSHYDGSVSANCYFHSPLSKRNQFASKDGSDSDHPPLSHGVPQGSLLELFFF